MIGSELPKGWDIQPLKEVVTSTKGKKPKQLSELPFDNSIPYIDIKALEKDLIEQYADVESSKSFSPNDIAVVWDGARCGWVSKSKEGAIGSTICALTPKNNIESNYLYYFLLEKYPIVNSKGRGVGIPHVDPTFFWDMEVPIPSPKEQKQIAEKLDKFFDQIETIKEASNKIPELLKNFRQQVLTYAVTGKLTEEWRKERQLDEWHTELAKDCCEKVQSGGTPKGGQFALSGIPFLKVYNIVGNKIDFESEPQYVSEEIQNSQIKKSITYPGDVIMNIVGPPLNKVAIIPDTYKEWNINQAITLFRPKEYLNNQYLYYFFCEGASVNSVLDKTRGVVGQVNISLSQCREFAISIPPMEEQLEIVKRVQTLFDILDDVERRYNTLCEKLDKLPQALLCKAFKGELTK